MADRPAAELLRAAAAKLRDSTAAELIAELPDFYKDDDKLSMSERQYRDVLIRLARAEQALADNERIIARLFDVIAGWEANAALRASQGGQ